MSVDTHDFTFEVGNYDRLTDSDIAALNAFENAIAAEELPDDPPRSLELTEAEARNIPEFIAFRELWARDPDGSLAAMGYGHWRKDVNENMHLLDCTIQVRADRRRRGLGRALLRHVVDVADAERRTVLTFGTNERIPAGAEFAKRIDARPAFKAHNNRLTIADLDRALMQRWVDEGPARAEGYSLFTIDGAMPDDLIERFVDLTDVMNTAPRDDLDMEDSHLTPDQLRQAEASMDRQGTEKWTLIARHDGTGELVGYTEVMWNPLRPWIVRQGDTGVRPQHRGHALGKWLKATMAQRILEERPDATCISTGNADSNDAMLGINHAMGFKPHLAATWWNADVGSAKAYLDSRT